MYDSETVRLIQNAEPLQDLDLERLPQFLTEAYAKVVAARLGAVELGNGQRDEAWAQNIALLRGLADTYEGLAVFLPEDNTHRASCAFVAASAHHTLSQARLIEARAHRLESHAPSLTAHGVGSEVAACLLFLISGQQADAAEASKMFEIPTGQTYEADLLQGLASLASGDGQQMKTFATAVTTAYREDHTLDYIDRAAANLWFKLAHAVRLIERIALGIEVAERPNTVIDSILRSLESIQGGIQTAGRAFVVRPSLAGPYHLARLLRRVSEDLLGSAVVRLPTPPGIEPERWRDFIQHFSARRPFLWRNHLDALSKGFLDNGRSFVLTFPTGAGKTTVTELRIATELLRGQKVAYLAPTRALVHQVSRELAEGLVPIAESVVRGSFLEDFGDDAAGKVFVQTPEQCLAYLSFDPEAHQDLGLIVIDEAHQLSGELPAANGNGPIPGRRAVDAMWTLLALLQRSPNTDVILISAMVRNGGALADWLATVTQRPATLLELTWKPTRQARGVVVYESSIINSLNNTLEARKHARRGGNPRKADRTGIEAQPIGLFCHTQVWAETSGFARFPVLPHPVPLEVGTYWNVTSNRNAVGGLLLGAMAQAKMRPIVFSQQIGWTTNIADAAAQTLRVTGNSEVTLTPDEEALLAAAAVEIGDARHVEGIRDGRIGVHHGLLLLPERAAVESAFRRADGLYGLVATPTVAQGINLPAEAVVIAGDDRWTEEMEEGGMQPLAVHELLNAAGRAGRAGHYAHGIVIDLPGKVLTVEDRNGVYAVTGLEHIMSLFGLPDQCLDVVDPITQVIDRIQVAGVDNDVSEYIVRRAAGNNDDQLVRILRATFGNALSQDGEDRAVAQTALLRSHASSIDRDQEDAADLDLDTWRDFAGQVGASPFIVARIAAGIPPGETTVAWTFNDLLAFAIAEVNQYLFGLVNPASAGLSRILPRHRVQRGRAYEFTESVADWENRWRTIMPDTMRSWITGQNLIAIGQRFHAFRAASGRVNSVHLGRRFAIQSASSIAHGASVVARIVETIRSDALSPVLKIQLPLISGCIREGFDEPDKLLLFWHLRRYGGHYPRVVVHSVYPPIQGRIDNWTEGIDIDRRRLVIRRAWGDM